MKISVRCEYAIHSLLYLKINQADHPVELSEVAGTQGLPSSYLAKIFSDLNRAGLIDSFRGVGGGYRIRDKVKRISLKDIFIAMEGDAELFRDEWRLRRCRAHSYCKIRSAFARAHESMLEELDKVTIDDLAENFLQEGVPDWIIPRQKRNRAK